MVIATDRFADLARQAAEQSGLPLARIVQVAHPIGGAKKAELNRRGEAAVEDIINRLLGH